MAQIIQVGENKIVLPSEFDGKYDDLYFGIEDGDNEFMLFVFLALGNDKYANAKYPISRYVDIRTLEVEIEEDSVIVCAQGYGKLDNINVEVNKR